MDIDNFLNEAFFYEEVGIQYFAEVLKQIKEITEKDVKYVLWLCESIEDIKDVYESENINIVLESFDKYEVSDIVLSDIGKAGKLYGYEE